MKVFERKREKERVLQRKIVHPVFFDSSFSEKKKEKKAQFTFTGGCQHFLCYDYIHISYIRVDKSTHIYKLI